jgi:Protein of unknown function (DUF3108)
MPKRLRRLVAAGLFLAQAPLPAAAGVAVFDLRIAGVPAGQMSIDLDHADGSYQAASTITATGLVGLLTGYAFDGRATGTLRPDGSVVPARFVATSSSPRADRKTQILFEDGTPVEVSVVPPRDSTPDPASQAGTLDPVSAGFVLLRENAPEKLCNTTIDLFDGSRRSRIRLGAVTPRDGVLICRGTFARIEGEALTSADGREFPFELQFRMNGDGLAAIHRIEAPTKFGMAVIERRG